MFKHAAVVNRFDELSRQAMKLRVEGNVVYPQDSSSRSKLCFLISCFL